MSIKKTGLIGTKRPNYAALDGNCYIANGINRLLSYNRVAVTNGGIRMTGSAPTKNTTGTDGNLTQLGVYKFRIEYYNVNKGYPSAWSGSLTVTLTGADDSITIDIVADANIDSQVTHARVYRTTNGGETYYLDETSTGGLVAFTGTATTYKSTVADSLLTTPMGELDEDGNNVNVHGAPPTCPYLAVHEGRLVTTGSIKHTTGTVTMAADPTVEGAGTPGWTQGMKGWKFLVDGDSRLYTVDEVTDSDTLELTESYAGTTGAGKSYTLFGPDGSVINYSYVNIDGFPMPESWPSNYNFPVDRDSDDENTGLCPAKGGTILSRWHSIWRIQGHTPLQMENPLKISDSIGFAPESMAKDQNGNVIGAGEEGIYKVQGTQVVDIIATTIKNIFSGVDSPPWYVDKTQMDKWHAVYIAGRYWIWVCSSGETSPDKCVVLDTNVPMPDGSPSAFPFALPADCSRIIEDANKKKWIYFGWKGFNNYINPTATNDGAGTTSTKRGTATAADATSITDSTATFTDDILGCPVKILSGTGIGSTGWIGTRNSTTKFTVETAFGTTPAIGDTYAIGCITAYRKTKWMDFGQLLDKLIRKVKAVFKKQSSTYSLYIKHYTDFSTTQLGSTKYLDMSLDDRYHASGFAANRAKHHQLEFGIDDTDRPFELRELEIEIAYHGKAEETKEATS